ncbi:MAG TPA: hypothetical protein PKE32_06915, partial [Miltoncostaeaceae bacterium]|nr:hypothetical protein [Miltoncostaeaceae bacterium]
PGQWYLDRTRRRVVYRPLPGESVDKIGALAPTTECVLRIAGSQEQPTRDVVVRGLTVMVTNTTLVAGGFGAGREGRAGAVGPAGGRPAVFLANLGTVADHTARATFAANLFAAAGIEVRQGSDADDDARVAEAFAASDARLACICSSDDVYAERAAAVARSLARAGAVRIYLAGRPGDGEAALRQAGVHEFAYVGCDALALLTGALDVLGVPA